VGGKRPGPEETGGKLDGPGGGSGGPGGKAQTPDGTAFKAFKLQYAVAEDAAKTLEKMIGGAWNRSRIVADRRTNQVFVEAPAEDLFRVAKILQELDIPVKESRPTR
jgi:type II secretory pathway component HofQ